jgi:hypothetical protein
MGEESVEDELEWGRRGRGLLKVKQQQHSANKIMLTKLKSFHSFIKY